jgi:glycosyltransferase involved in cell wall biosynthesis
MAGGGAERQLTYLAREHVRAGLDVHVAIIQGGPNSERLAATGATIHQIRAFGNYDPLILVRLLRTMRAVCPDVVQCWLLQMEVAGGMAASMCGTPWVFSERAAPEAYPPSFKTWLRVKIAAWSAAIVSNSSIGDQFWQGRFDERVKRYVIPNGLPLDEIDAAPIVARDDDNVPSDAPLILAAGRFESEKNLDVIVRAIRLVSDTHPLQMLICGNGSLRHTIAELIDEEHLSHRVRLTGHVDNLWSLMKRADVLVSASVFEGNPNVVLEAMACGCPLVVSDIPAHRELLDEDTAVFVKRTHPRELADAVGVVLRDPRGASERARRARARVEHHSLPVVARRYIEVYRTISTRGRQPRRETT